MRESCKYDVPFPLDFLQTSMFSSTTQYSHQSQEVTVTLPLSNLQTPFKVCLKSVIYSQRFTVYQLLPIPPPHSSWQMLIFLFLWICLLWDFHRRGIMKFVAFESKNALGIMFSRLIHIVAYIGTWFLTAE